MHVQHGDSNRLFGLQSWRHNTADAVRHGTAGVLGAAAGPVHQAQDRVLLAFHLLNQALLRHHDAVQMSFGTTRQLGQLHLEGTSTFCSGSGSRPPSLWLIWTALHSMMLRMQDICTFSSGFDISLHSRCEAL